MFKIYYSRSNNVNDFDAGVHIETLIRNLPIGMDKIELSRHTRGGIYDRKLLDDADLVIVVANAEKDTSMYIGKGCYSEIQRATENDIPIFLIVKDLKTKKMFVQKITFDDIEEHDTDDWEKYGEIFYYNNIYDCPDMDEEDIDPDHYTNHGAVIDDQSQLELLMRNTYEEFDLEKFMGPTSVSLLVNEVSTPTFSPGRFEYIQNDQELLLVMRAR